MDHFFRRHLSLPALPASQILFYVLRLLYVQAESCGCQSTSREIGGIGRNVVSSSCHTSLIEGTRTFASTPNCSTYCMYKLKVAAVSRRHEELVENRKELLIGVSSSRRMSLILITRTAKNSLFSCFRKCNLQCNILDATRAANKHTCHKLKDQETS